jgi:hypothetical protein
VTKDRSEVLSWLSASKKGADHTREKARAERSFESRGNEWLAGVEAGRIGRRRGRGKPYSDAVADYPVRLPQLPMPGVRADGGRRDRRGRVADVGRPAQPRGPSRSRIVSHVAVA